MTLEYEQVLMEKIRQLPQEKISEVETFVDFLNQRLSRKQFMEEIYQLAEPSFKKVWDNPKDAKYDDL